MTTTLGVSSGRISARSLSAAFHCSGVSSENRSRSGRVDLTASSSSVSSSSAVPPAAVKKRYGVSARRMNSSTRLDLPTRLRPRMRMHCPGFADPAAS
ncbi:hypothetical protein SUDANB51_03900 [Streptomyces sp. enrichment culture]